MLKPITACMALLLLALPMQTASVTEALNNPQRLAKDLERA